MCSSLLQKCSMLIFRTIMQRSVWRFCRRWRRKRPAKQAKQTSRSDDQPLKHLHHQLNLWLITAQVSPRTAVNAIKVDNIMVLVHQRVAERVLIKLNNQEKKCYRQTVQIREVQQQREIQKSSKIIWGHLTHCRHQKSQALQYRRRTKEVLHSWRGTTLVNTQLLCRAA